MPDEGKECGMKGIACEMTGIALARGNGILYKDRCPLFLSFFPSFFFLSSSRNNLFPQEKVVASGGWERWEPHGGGMAWRSAYSL